MKPAALALLLGVLLLPLPLLAQVTGGGGGGSGGNQSNQVQQQGETQQQGGSQLQVETQEGSQMQVETLQDEGTQQQGQTETQEQTEQQGEQATEQATVPTPEVESEPQDAKGVSLEGLDKITARTFAFEAPLDETVRFGYLEITARRCVVAAEEDTPERSAFLEVVEAKPGRDPVKVFSGWMFASSPSVSAMEHAVYDIWVVDCSGYEGEPTATAATGAEPAPEEVEAPVEGVERPLD